MHRCKDTYSSKLEELSIRVDSNKTELFTFLALAISTATIPKGKVLLSTNGDSVVVVPQSADVTSLHPCNHEEADYRILLH